MRFCDFFSDYKIGLKGLKRYIPFRDLPLNRKVAVLLLFIFFVAGLITFFLDLYIITYIIIFILLGLFIVILFIESSVEKQREMLDKFYIPHSKSRINMLLSLFEKYNLDSKDAEVINLLIAQAEESKINNDPFLSLKKPIKILSAIIVPIIGFVIQKLADSGSDEQLISIALQSIIVILCIFSIIISIYPFIYLAIYPDGYKYEGLINDLKQILIFDRKKIHFII